MLLMVLVSIQGFYLKNFPCDKHIVDNNKNDEGIISLRVFNGCIQIIKKQIPHYLNFK